MFYLEATGVFEDGRDSPGEARLALVYDAVAGLDLDNFLIGLSVSQYGASTPSAQRARHFLLRKANEVDADDLVSRRAYVSFEYVDSGWCIEFTFYPKRLESRGKAADSTLAVR